MLKNPVQVVSFFKHFFFFCITKNFTTHGKFHSQKVFCLEDINEKETGYGNHN